jgi:hypothetical protein
MKEVAVTFYVTPEQAPAVIKAGQEALGEKPKAETRETKVVKPKEKKKVEKPEVEVEDEELEESEDEELEDDSDEDEDLEESEDDSDEDDSDEDEVEEKPKAKTTKNTKEAKVTFEDVSKAIREYTKSVDDLKTARSNRLKILAKFGVKDPTDLKSPQFKDVIAAFKKAAKK